MLHRLDGEYGRALRSYDRLVRLDPAAHVVASYSRALVHMYMGHFDETFRQLDEESLTQRAGANVSRAGLVLHRPDSTPPLMKAVVEASKHARRTSIHGDVPERAGKA